MKKPNNLKNQQKFSKENQPTPEAKKEGWRRKIVLKDIAGQLISGDAKEAMRILADFLGVDVDKLDLETAMHLKQMEKALVKGDTAAYNAVLDRLNGKPVQAVSVSTPKVKSRKYRIVKPKQ